MIFTNHTESEKLIKQSAFLLQAISVAARDEVTLKQMFNFNFLARGDLSSLNQALRKSGHAEISMAELENFRRKMLSKYRR